MSIISDTLLLQNINNKNILIDPFREECLSPNGYDIHLGNVLTVYTPKELDCKKDYKNETRHIVIPKKGFVIEPNELYLGITQEYTETCAKFVPFINGKSSLGRLGVFIHVTAGQGDAGFKGYWTLELVCVKPIKIYAGMPIGQLTYHTIDGTVNKSYNFKSTSKYNNKDPLPIESRMWKNWNERLQQWD